MKPEMKGIFELTLVPYGRHQEVEEGLRDGHLRAEHAPQGGDRPDVRQRPDVFLGACTPPTGTERIPGDEPHDTRRTCWKTPPGDPRGNEKMPRVFGDTLVNVRMWTYSSRTHRKCPRCQALNPARSTCL